MQTVRHKMMTIKKRWRQWPTPISSSEQGPSSLHHRQVTDAAPKVIHDPEKDTFIGYYSQQGVISLITTDYIDLVSSKLPKVNIKFSHVAVAGDGGKKRLAEGSTGYQDWERIGFPLAGAGEVVSLRKLTKYKYHIDLGGCGDHIHSRLEIIKWSCDGWMSCVE